MGTQGREPLPLDLSNQMLTLHTLIYLRHFNFDHILHLAKYGVVLNILL